MRRSDALGSETRVRETWATWSVIEVRGGRHGLRVGFGRRARCALWWATIAWRPCRPAIAWRPSGSTIAWRLARWCLHARCSLGVAGSRLRDGTGWMNRATTMQERYRLRRRHRMRAPGSGAGHSQDIVGQSASGVPRCRRPHRRAGPRGRCRATGDRQSCRRPHVALSRSRRRVRGAGSRRRVRGIEATASRRRAAHACRPFALRPRHGHWSSQPQGERLIGQTLVGQTLVGQTLVGQTLVGERLVVSRGRS
jgi:hypothetical protein